MTEIKWQGDNYSGEILEAGVLTQILNLIFFQRSCCLPVLHFFHFGPGLHRISGWMQRIFREQLGSGSLKPLGFKLSFIDHYPREPGKL